MHKIEVPSWAVERGRRMNNFHEIDPAKTALVVVDLQNAFMVDGQPLANQHALDIIPNVNRLARAIRAAGGKLAWTRHTFVETAPFAPPAERSCRPCCQQGRTREFVDPIDTICQARGQSWTSLTVRGAK